MGQVPTPDSSWKSLPSWLFFALLVIGPPAALVTFARTLTQNPLLVIFLILGYEILLFVLRFTGKIWQQLEAPLAERIAQWLTLRTQELTSRYYRRYCQYLVSEHQVFDVKGLSTRTAHDLALEQVFVDLHIQPVPSHQVSADPLHQSPSLQGTHTIWDYLSTPTLANLHLVVLGAPGSGKTTLLKHLALTLAQPKTTPRRRGMRHMFPILLFLRDHAHAITDQSDFSLADAVREHIQRTWQQSIPATWIHRQLERGHCLVLLDGLDEVADNSMRQLVVAWVQRQLIAQSSNRFVLTSRPYGYRDHPLEGVTVLDVQAFTLEQVGRFVENWYLANEFKSWGKDDLSVQLHAHEGTRDLLQRLRQAPALLALAVNPLLLTMIATVHRYRSSLPGKRVDLYAEICEVFLGKRYEARGITQDLSPAQKQQVLQSLAYALMQRGTLEMSREEAKVVIAPTLALVSTQLSPTDFLELIENTSGLLLERDPGIYSFVHQTFQEYLAAVHIKEEGLEQVLVDQVTKNWWHETIRLYCAQTDATTLILACLASNPLTAELLALAFECDSEKLKIRPPAQTRLNAVLELRAADPDLERQRIIAQALLARRIRQMIHLHQGIYIDRSLITCAEYQVFLDEQRSQGAYYQPDHWPSSSFPEGLQRSPVLGVRKSDAEQFCTWLTARDGEGWQYRLPNHKEWPLEERKKYAELPAETGYWVRDTSWLTWSHGEPSAAIHQQLLDCITRARAHAKGLDLYFTRDADQILSLDRTTRLDHNRDLDQACKRALDRVLNHDYVRIHALGDAIEGTLKITRELDYNIKVIRRNRWDSAADVISIMPDFLDLYTTLFCLQERITGNLSACEGILLVKERQR